MKKWFVALLNWLLRLFDPSSTNDTVITEKQVVPSNLDELADSIDTPVDPAANSWDHWVGPRISIAGYNLPVIKNVEGVAIVPIAGFISEHPELGLESNFFTIQRSLKAFCENTGVRFYSYDTNEYPTLDAAIDYSTAFRVQMSLAMETVNIIIVEGTA